MKLMILGDSPTKETGFARVVRRLLEAWLEAGVFEEIHIWGIGYWGYPHPYPPHVKIYPAAGPEDTRWESTANLSRFAKLAEGLKVTHLWMIQDVWGLHALAVFVMRLQRDYGTRTALYFPVDAPLDPSWTEIAGAVEFPVAYTQYGFEQMKQALETPLGDHKMDRRRREAVKRMRVLPHGCEPGFEPVGDIEALHAMRAEMTGGKCRPDDFLMVSVAVHQRRKGLTQTIQVWHALCKLLGEEEGARRRLHLYLHCEPINHTEGSSLPMILQQLGVEAGCHFPPKSYFLNNRPTLSDAKLNLLYNAADLLLSTSLGEGWGLPITEAMAAGTPVAAPAHTSLEEIIGASEGTGYGKRGYLLALAEHPDMVIGDNSRLRYRVDVGKAATQLRFAIQNPEHTGLGVRAASAWIRQPEMAWAFIAEQWLELMEAR
jgi:glycosyltransferase involved in cell wall biosynthesis